jgi:ABC-type amino acid transport substrate-binding protein
MFGMPLTGRVAAAVVALALSALAATGEAKDWTKLRVVTEGAFPPFNYLDRAGRPAGFDVDIARAVCAKARLRCTLGVHPWKGMFEGLIAGRYDAIVASVYITAERERRVAFTNPYYRAPTWFAARKAAGIAISPAGLRGRVIGVQNATVFADYAEAVYGKIARIRRYASQYLVNDALRRGSVDVVLSSRPVLERSLLRGRGGKKFALVGKEIRSPLLGKGAGIVVRKENSDLVALLNTAIAGVRADGTYDHIARKYFAYDIYGSP